MFQKQNLCVFITGILVTLFVLYAFWYYRTVQQTNLTAANVEIMAKWVCAKDPAFCGQAPADTTPTP